MVRLNVRPSTQADVSETAFDKRGSNCSGTDGAKNRVLTLSNTSLTTAFIVFINGTFLHPVHDYTATHKAASSTITLLNNVDNGDYIDGFYFT